MPIDSGGEIKAAVAMMGHLQEGVCLFDADQRLVACNDKYAEIYNIPKDLTKPGVSLIEILRQRIAAGKYPEMDGDAYIANRLKAVADAEERVEVHHLRDGRVFSVKHKPVDGGGWLTTHSDITEIYQLKQEIEHLAYHDQLTGLPNRRLFSERIKKAVASCGEGKGVNLMFVDLDGFKAINDKHGHAAGDDVLKIVAERLRNCFRKEDTVARIGGDEFAVVQSGFDQNLDVRPIAHRVVGEIGRPIMVGRENVVVGCSIGIANTGDMEAESNRLIREADEAMYLAKRAGGRRYQIHGDADKSTDAA